jgi:hypothetical protein
MRTRHIAIAFGLLAAAAAWRFSFAGDPADDAFDSPEVKELGARADALKLDDEIALMKRIQRSLDGKLLTPSEDAWRGFESLRGRADAGVARILHRGVCAGLVTPREGGAYWSFTKRSNSYDDDPEIELQRGEFSTGFAGANTGSVVQLDDVDVASIAESSVPDDLRLTANEFDAKSGGRRSDRPKAETGATYVVRAILWDKCDVLAAFKVVAVDAYGATIAWRVLKVYDVPKRANRPARPGEGGRGGGAGQNGQNGKDGSSGK